MMWDFSGANSNPRSGPGGPSSPIPIPSPRFPSPQPYSDADRRLSSYSAVSSMPMPNPVMSQSGHLAVPQTQPPVMTYSNSDHILYQSHSNHQHHHHHRHRVHSSPMPPKPVIIQQPVVITTRPTSSHHRPSQSVPQVTFVTPPRTPKPPKMKPPRPAHAHTPASSPNFQYSRCTGKKKALCIGINYLGQENELRGCINDAKGMKDFLITSCGYRERDIVILTDDGRTSRDLPTRKNILDAMRWLVSGAHSDDSLFFHYSGHGGQTPDLDEDELDGYDETIYPLDFKKRGHITDDEMHDIMVRPLPPGCRLTALFDSCHSGTVLDLPFIYSSHGRLKGAHVRDRALRRKSSPADVISWSGCQDGQTSADTFHGGVAVGAMSHAFISSLRKNPVQSYHQLLKSVREILHPKFSQKPQIGSSHHIDTSLQFVL